VASVRWPWLAAAAQEVLQPTVEDIEALAYRQDFAAIAIGLAGDSLRVADLTPTDLTKDALRAAFAGYADAHEAASIRRCWSTWNTLCGFLYTGEFIGANPMPLIGRPKVAKSLPKSLGDDTGG
jgi:site-specific recombinase XerD